MEAIANYEPLAPEHIDELQEALLDARVYQYLGGMPTAAEFRQELLNSIAGPPAHRDDQTWLYFVSRCATSGRVVGQLEATLHHGFAEIGFVFSPWAWGRGFAQAGLDWLKQQVWQRQPGCPLWATVHPLNVWSSRLLERCGYWRVAAPDQQVLLTYDVGDWVYRLSSGPHPASQPTD